MSTCQSAAQVGEIFSAAGEAFTRLGDLAIQLYNPDELVSESAQTTRSGLPNKRKPETALSKKAATECLQSSQQAAFAATIRAQQKHTADLTLNMLNASENEVDTVEKLPYGE